MTQATLDSLQSSSEKGQSIHRFWRARQNNVYVRLYRIRNSIVSQQTFYPPFACRQNSTSPTKTRATQSRPIRRLAELNDLNVGEMYCTFGHDHEHLVGLFHWAGGHGCHLLAINADEPAVWLTHQVDCLIDG